MPARAAARISASRGMCLGRGVPEVTQDREVDVRIEVAERLNFDVRQQLTDPLDAVEDRRAR